VKEYERFARKSGISDISISFGEWIQLSAIMV
jgi:hypothetical protein